MDMTTLAAIWIACALVAAIIGSARRAKVGMSALTGLVLGPVGVLLVLIQKPAEPR